MMKDVPHLFSPQAVKNLQIITKAFLMFSTSRGNYFNDRSRFTGKRYNRFQHF